MDDWLTPEFLRVAWLVLGGALILLEFVVPGAVVVFFGAGAILTGMGAALGWLPGPGSQLLFWMVSSFLLVVTLRRQVRRMFPALEAYQPPDEVGEMVGRVVEVISEVTSEDANGRVRYQGSSWQARSREGRIPAGTHAKISGRDDLVVYVEPLDS